MTVQIDNLQRVRAHEFKVSQGDTYAAAERAPVAILKRRGGTNPGLDAITHVLMSAADYRRLTEGGS